MSEGAMMHALAAELFPVCRSITGQGLRDTLATIRREIPLDLHRVPSGTQVLDWTVPDEWNIRDAWIADDAGRRLVDFKASNLHVVNYSAPFRGRVALADLRPRLYSLPDRPDWIPYRTTYYKRDWGFCVRHRQWACFAEPEYDVCIDSTLAPGALDYGELLLPGESADEFLISAHCCHPSLANDNLSGIVVAIRLAQELLRQKRRRFSYRFLFAPGTIGAITWLARNEAAAKRVRFGLVLTCLGDAAPFTYKKSRRGTAEIDRTVEQVLRNRGGTHRVKEFSPYGYDERQFCSPGFNMPVGRLMRSEHGTFPEYHTSGDNLDFISPRSLEESLELLRTVVDLVEAGQVPPEDHGIQPAGEGTGRTFVNAKPWGEPQLGKYGVYEHLSGDVMPALWVLNYSDGAHSLNDIALRAGLPFDTVAKAADVLAALNLIEEVGLSA